MTPRDFSVDTMLRANAVRHAGRDAVVDPTVRLSWAELDARVERLAMTLLARGIGPDDRVALLLIDGAAFLELFYASARIGAAALTLNWRLAPAEIAWILENASPALTVAHERFAGLLAESDAGETVMLPGDEAAFPHMAEDARDVPLPGLDPQRALYMMYTSGTTGRPKGCLQSNAGTAIAGMGYALRFGFAREDRLLSTNPLFHVAGLHQAMAMLACGGACVFPSRDADPKAMFALMHEEGCTTGSALPPLIRPWKPLQEARGGSVPFAKYATGGGTGRPEAWAWLEKDWDCRVIGGYGQTEIGGFATFIDYPDMLDHPHSIGWPMPHVEMVVLGEDGAVLPDGEEGEIAMRGPSVMLGYWNNEAATEAALADGWLRSGDLGTRDEHGLFRLLGRSKELIKTGGENVYPAEVDAVLLAMSEVADAGCAGVADRRWGEAVKAFVVLAPGAALSREEIVARFKGRIAGYKRPRYVEFMDALPRDPIGKLRRVELAARPVTPDQAA